MKRPLRQGGNGADWIWKRAGALAGIAGGILARKLIDGARTRVSARGDAPLNPAHERMTWLNALVWAAAIGIGASLGNLLARRIVAAVWTRRTHRPVAAMPQ